MCTVAALEIITMSPRGRVRIEGSTSLRAQPRRRTRACATRARPRRGSVSATVWPRDAMPALFTRMSTAPEVGEHPSTISSQAAVVVDRRGVRDRTPAELLDLGDRFARGVVVAPVVDRDVGAVGGEPERDRLADPPSAARHECDPSVRASVTCPSYCVR